MPFLAIFSKERVLQPQECENEKKRANMHVGGTHPYMHVCRFWLILGTLELGGALFGKQGGGRP